MKKIRQIALGALVAMSTFGAIFYTSCSKDACKDVTCQNSGTCTDGTCVCPTGIAGTNCETIYRTGYANTYVGNGTDNGTPSHTYTNFRMVFSNPGTDVTKMQVVLQDATTAPVVALPITLSNFTASSTVFTVTSTTAAGYTYTGTGTVSDGIASMTLTEVEVATSLVTVYTFTNMAKQ